MTQGVKSFQSLDDLRAFFDVGQLVQNKRYDNHREHLLRYVVRRRTDLLETIVPFFQRYPLRTAKRHDFEKFVRVLELMSIGQHRSREGLSQIAEIAQTMNRRKPRNELIRILRDHTPDIHDSG